MTKTFPNLATSALIVVFSLPLTACETTAPAPQPIVVQEAPRPAPTIARKPAPPPPLIIPARTVTERMDEALVRAAGNHAVLMEHINQIPSETISSADHLNQTMDGLSQVFSPGLGPAMIGYGALIGAQNTEFTEALLETARYEGLDAVVYQLYADPNYVATLPNAELAASDIQNAWASDIAAIGNTGAHIKRQSYELQKQSAWKKLRTDDRTGRLAIMGQSRSIRYTPPANIRQSIAEIGTIRAFDTDAELRRRQFWQTYGRASQPQSQTFSSQYKGLMNKKALTLSALEILGATGAPSKDWIENYMTSPQLNQCTNTARLNVEQCLAAGHFKYEDAFCVAQHELTEISTCLTQGAL